MLFMATAVWTILMKHSSSILFSPERINNPCLVMTPTY
nr:hypothetical protein [Escherichia coli]